MSRHPARAALIALLALLPAGCATPQPAPPSRASAAPSAVPPPVTAATPQTQTPQTQAPQTKKWVDLEPGDCLAAAPPTDPAQVMVTVVDCGSTHRAETFLRADIPVNAALDDVASSRCTAGLTDYTGRAAGDDWVITYLIDSVQDRTTNNPYPSTVICLLQSANGAPLTGTARF